MEDAIGGRREVKDSCDLTDANDSRDHPIGTSDATASVIATTNITDKENLPATTIQNSSNNNAKKNKNQEVEPNRKLRRSSRGDNRISMSEHQDGAQQFRRMEVLFFLADDEDYEGSSSRRDSSVVRNNSGAPTDANKTFGAAAAEEQDAPKPRRSRRQQQEDRCRRAELVKKEASNINPATSTSPKEIRTVKVDKWTLELVFESPNVYVIDNFLTTPDLEYLDRAILGSQFQQSYVDGKSEESILDSQHRTSTFLSFPKQGNKNLNNIEQKAATLMGCYSTDPIEPLQLVRYLPGQFFGAHHDMADYDESTGEVALPAKHVMAKRRLVTIFCYLNDLEPDQGGCTVFPLCVPSNHNGEPLRVRPKRGRAVVFGNVTRAGLPDPRTIHAGETVIDNTKKDTQAARVKGEKKTKGKPAAPVKYGLNIWMCER